MRSNAMKMEASSCSTNNCRDLFFWVFSCRMHASKAVFSVHNFITCSRTSESRTQFQRVRCGDKEKKTVPPRTRTRTRTGSTCADRNSRSVWTWEFLFERSRRMGGGAALRYPSPLVKHDLAKLGKDADSRRAALGSLRTVVEDLLDAATLPRFLQQVESSRDGRRHAAALVQDLARVHGVALAAHIPHLLHILTQTLQTSATVPGLQADCAKAVAAVAKYCATTPPAIEEVLRRLCLPLVEILPAKLEPLSTGAATCLRSLVESDEWKYAPATLISQLCLKAALALTTRSSQTTAHMHLLHSLASVNASALAQYSLPLLHLALDILVSSASSWQHRVTAVQLLESLLKASDYTTLASELRPILDALTKCRHDRMLRVREAVNQAIHTTEALASQEDVKRKMSAIIPDAQAEDGQEQSGTKSNGTQEAGARRKRSDALIDHVDHAIHSGSPKRSQISDSPPQSPKNASDTTHLRSPRSLADSSCKFKYSTPLSARTSPSKLDSPSDSSPNQPKDESDYFCAYFYDTKENGSWRKIVHHIHESPTAASSGPKSSATASPQPSVSPRAGRTSPVRQISVPPLPLASVVQGKHCTKRYNRQEYSHGAQSDSKEGKSPHSAAAIDSKYLPDDTSAASPSSTTRDIRVLDNNEDLVASCERNLQNDGCNGTPQVTSKNELNCTLVNLSEEPGVQDSREKQSSSDSREMNTSFESKLPEGHLSIDHSANHIKTLTGMENLETLCDQKLRESQTEHQSEVSQRTLHRTAVESSLSDQAREIQEPQSVKEDSMFDVCVDEHLSVSNLSSAENNQSTYVATDSMQLALDRKLDEEDSTAASVNLFHSLAQLANADKQRALKTADLLGECEDWMLYSAALMHKNGVGAPATSDLPSSANEETRQHQGTAETVNAQVKVESNSQCQEAGESVDTELETSSGEWSVRDNPIAEDHALADQLIKHRDDISIICNQRDDNQWTESIVCEMETCSHATVGDEAGPKEMELEMSEDKTASTTEFPLPSSSTKELHLAHDRRPPWQRTLLRGTACAGLMIPLAITISKHLEFLQQNADALGLPPPT